MALRYDPIIFDMDGTLLDTLDDLADSVNYALETHGFPKREKEHVRAAIGNGVGKLIECCMPEAFREDEYNKVLSTFKEYYEKHSNDKTHVFDGMIEMIKKLKEQGATVAIVSNKIDSAVQELAEIYFPGLIDCVTGEREGVRRKPEPDVIFATLEKLDKSPKKAVYIGDTEVDIQTAKNAGIKGISITWGFRDPEVLAINEADEIVMSVEQLYEMLTENFARSFFRLYDRMLAAGLITFAETGMKRDDFTRLCIDDSYSLPYAEIERICKNMKLGYVDTQKLLSLAAPEEDEEK